MTRIRIPRQDLWNVSKNQTCMLYKFILSHLSNTQAKTFLRRGPLGSVSGAQAGSGEAEGCLVPGRRGL